MSNDDNFEARAKQTVKATGLDLPFGTYKLKKEKQYFKIVDEKEREDY
jgi:hypothetical protein